MIKHLLLFIFLLSIQFTSSRKPTLWKNGNYDSLYNLSTTDLEDFMAFKEEQYTRRKLFVKEKCKEYSKDLNQHPSQYSRDPNRGKYVVNHKDNIAVCQIPKVASSTWLYRFNYLLEDGKGQNFTTLPKPERAKMHYNAERYDSIAFERTSFFNRIFQSWWNHTKDEQIRYMSGLESEDLMTFVVIRHPFDRIG